MKKICAFLLFIVISQSFCAEPTTKKRVRKVPQQQSFAAQYKPKPAQKASVNDDGFIIGGGLGLTVPNFPMPNLTPSVSLEILAGYKWNLNEKFSVRIYANYAWQQFIYSFNDYDYMSNPTTEKIFYNNHLVAVNGDVMMNFYELNNGIKIGFYVGGGVGVNFMQVVFNQALGGGVTNVSAPVGMGFNGNLGLYIGNSKHQVDFGIKAIGMNPTLGINLKYIYKF